MPEQTVYVAGGTVQAGGGVYLERTADRELLELCRAGAFAFILTSRQMGKSSLMVRTVERLYEEDVRSVIVDLTALGADVTQDQWYKGFLLTVEDQLGLSTNATRWWQEHEELGVPQRFNLFLSKVVLQEVSQDIVIFVDEIDTTLRLGFTDDFFTAIRYLYNARADTPDLTRLSFVLIGVATPGDLIKDQERTPFNIGQRVELTDFTFDEARPLVAGLSLPAEQEGPVLGSVLSWTGGHPYLTLRVFRSLAEKPLDEWSDEAITRRVSDLFFGAMSEQDSNLQFVRDMLTKKAPDSAAVLETYRDIRRGKKVRNEEQSLFKSWLKLSGVVCARNGFLEVRNRIYQTVFTTEWVRNHLGVNWGRVLARIGLAILLLLILGAWPLAWYAWDQKEEAEKGWAESRKNLNEAEAARRSAETERIEARKQAKLAQFLREEALWQTRIAEQAAERARIAEMEARRQQGFAESGRQEAERQRSLAEDLKEVSLARGLALQSSTLRESRPDLFVTSTLLAAEALLRSQTTPAAAQILQDALPILPQNLGVSTFSGEIVGLSRDGSRLLIKAEDKVRVVRTKDAKALSEISYNIEHFLLSPDGRRVIGYSNNEALLWDAETGRQIALLKGSDSERTYSRQSPELSFSSDGRKLLILGYQKLRVLDIDSGDEIGQFEIKPSSRILATDTKLTMALLSHEGQLILWSAAGPSKLSWPEEKDRIVAAAFSGDGNRIVIGNDKGSVRVWDIKSNTEVWQVPAQETASVLAFGQSNLVLMASSDGTAHVWDIETKQEVTSLPHEKPVALMELNSDASRLLTVTTGRVLRVWETGTWSELARVGYQESFEVNGDISRIVTVSGNNVEAWDIKESENVVRFDSYPALAITSMDGHWGALLGGEKGVRILNLQSRDRPLEIPTSDEDSYVAFDSKGRRAAIGGGDDGPLQIWDLESKQNVFRFEIEKEILPAALSLDGHWIATMDREEYSVEIRDIPSGKIFAKLSHEEPLIANPRLSPDGRQIATSSMDGVVRIWEFPSGRQVTQLDHDESWATAMSFSPDSRQIATVGTEGTTRIWDIKTGHELRRLAHEDEELVTAVAFSPNGDWLAAGGDDGTTQIWEVATGRELARLVQEGSVASVAFSQDGRTITVAGEFPTIETLPWRANDLVAEVCRHLRRDLTPEEWREYLPDEPYRKTCTGLSTPNPN
ncbi:MAG TPA: AAA-like domain-containing protein [Thermoanaerobaculia bacterium]